MPRYQLARNHRRIAEVIAGERQSREADKWVAVGWVLDRLTRAIADVFAQSSATFDRDAFCRIAGLSASPAIRIDSGDAPHCRSHLQFRSDCDRCISERAAS